MENQCSSLEQDLVINNDNGSGRSSYRNSYPMNSFIPDLESEISRLRLSIPHTVETGATREIIWSSLESLPVSDYDGRRWMRGMMIEGGGDYRLSEDQMKEMIMELTDQNHLHQLMLDPLGNYFLLRLLQLCDQAFINRLLFSLTANQDLFLHICLHDLGVRAVMKLISRLIYPYQEMTIALVVSCHVLTLAKSLHPGNELLKRCFQTLSPSATELILLRIAQNCLELARDQAGCCILQVCIQIAEGRVQEVLESPLIQDAHTLSMHGYGDDRNYVIQYMIEMDGGKTGGLVVKKLRNKFAGLSMDKFASNVVEKCLRRCEVAAVNEIIFEIMYQNNNNNQLLLRLCTNPYGNYVIQTAISVAKGEAYNLIAEGIKSHWTVLQLDVHGRNVIAAAKRIKKKLNLNRSSSFK